MKGGSDMSSEVAKHTDEVTLTIDGVQVTAPKGELVIRTAERMGIEIPRFCDHPLLAPAGACRQCLVEVEGQRKPVASCTQAVADGMVVNTHLTSPVAKKAQEGIMELLLINHPLDCPMCDKGGECPLQNQAMKSGRADTRFHEHKREYEKPINISSQVLLDRERCVLCQRCTRFSDEIAGDKFIDLMDRSSAESINIYRDEVYDGEPGAEGDVPFNSYFSGNTVQICPVGALTGAQYRFRARPFDLVSSPSSCEHCAAGCAQRTDHRRGKVLRRLAGEDPQVNEEWNCDKGRWGFQYANAFDRLTTPLIRGEDGELHPASWTEALAKAAEGLRVARDGAYGVGVLTGGRLTVEDAYAYSKFARVVLGTNDIDFRSRPVSAEETDFLAAYEPGVTYADLETAKHVVIVGLEPEEECPIVFLRLRKAVRASKLKVTVVAPFLTRGLAKLNATLIQAAPGREPFELMSLDGLGGDTVILAGERLATVAGGLSGVAGLASRSGAKLAWIPRRAGDRGAVDAGCLPNLLPGGRFVGDAGARAELSGTWGLNTGHLSSVAGRDTDGILAAAANGKIGALVVAGVDPADVADPQLADKALDKVGFLISLELRMSAVARRADVVFPVAAMAEKAGSYVNWEGRLRTFEQALVSPNTGNHMTDGRVLDAIAAQLGVKLGTADVRLIQRELGSLPATKGSRPHAPVTAAQTLPSLAQDEAILATWTHLLDLGAMTDGDQILNGTARPPVICLSKGRAAALNVAEGAPVTVSTDRGSITLPAQITDLPDDVVWLPTNSPGSTVRRTLGPASVVTVGGKA
jgi:NADH-quinone oxidoreductase subunit G